MQRLFCAFPSAWPGCGLLLLRLAAGAPLLFATLAGLHEPESALWLHLIELLAGTLLVVGLWTPGGAILQVLINSWLAFSAAWSGQVTIINVLVGLSLAMLGPGAWSVDAHLYGRKRIEL